MAQLLEILEKLNPWWKRKEFETGFIRNAYLSKIKTFLKSKEIVVLTGVRRAGKTTLLFQTIHDLIYNQKIDPKKILFVNFDEPDLANLKNPIKEILDVYFQDVCSDKNTYLIFDEVQDIKDWEKWAKSIYDEKEHNLILSGSSSNLLDSKLSILISGRYLKISVFPLDFTEYLFFNNLSIKKDKISLASNKNKIMNLIKSYLKEGGFPRIVLEKNNSLKKEILKNYYETIIYKEIVSMHEVRNVKALRELIYYLCSNFSELYSYKQLNELLKIDFLTLKEFLHYAEEAKILFENSFFSYSLKTQARYNKKIYCIDNGLRNAVSFKFSKDEGKLAENLVFVELKRRDKEIYYWQNSKKQEVDFAIKNKDRSLTGINVSYTDEPNKREIQGLLEFKKEFKQCKNLIVLTKNLEKETKFNKIEIKFIPLWKWLLEDK